MNAEKCYIFAVILIFQSVKLISQGNLEPFWPFSRKDKVQRYM